jgi:putative lipoprotein
MQKLSKFTLFLAITALVLGACDVGSKPATKPAGPSEPPLTVTGTVTYLQRSALPSTAVVEVQLQDVSVADAPAEVISSQRIETQGKQAPFPYELPYRLTKIDPSHRYAVRATIMDGDKLLFTTTQSYPVITSGAPTRDVEIIVEPVTSN